MDFISFRAEKKLKKKLEELAELENRNKSEEYRDVFILGLEEKKKGLAVERYRKGDLSLGAASELAGITTWEFIELLRARRVPMNITILEVLEGVENL